MKVKKIAITVLVFLFVVCFYSQSNERVSDLKKSDTAFSFKHSKDKKLNGLTTNKNSDLKSNIQLYKLSSTQWANIGLAMGIAGSVMAGVGILCIVPGATLMGVSVANFGAPYSPQRVPPANPGYNMWFAGVGLLASGIALFVIGVPLAVIGFILYFNGGKFATLIESDKDETRLGFAIKL